MIHRLRRARRTIILDRREDGPPARCRLRALRQPVAADQRFAIKIGEHVAPDKPGKGAGCLEMAGAEDRYTFTATPGTLVYLKAEPPCTEEYIRWEMYDATNTLVTYGMTICRDIGRTLLEKGGSYTIRVFGEKKDATGDYGFTIQRE